MSKKMSGKKRMVFAVVSFQLLLLTVTGCGQGQQTTDLEQPVQELQTEKSAEIKEEEKGAEETKNVREAPTSYVSEEEMALADYWKGSDEAALAKVMKKAEKGEKITVALIGGSITQGTISNGSKDSEVADKKPYSEIFFKWWQDTFPDTEIECLNGGIGATDSYLGVHRVQDILDAKPDLVLVEFAVNDSNTQFYKKSYDNLIRTIAESETKPALLLLFMAQSDLTSAQENQSIIGFSYSLPMISYRNVIKDMEENGIYSEKELSGDTVHPSALGHAITGEILWKYLNSVYEARETYGEPKEIRAEAVTWISYQNARILDSETIEPESMEGFEEKEVFPTFPNSFATEQGGEIRFRVSFANLGLLYYKQTDGNGGQFEVYVDGELVDTLDADFFGGWGNYAESKECFMSDVPAEHEVLIKKKADSTGEEFAVLGLLVSDGEE